MVVKMVAKDCSRVCDWVLHSRAGEREMVVGYVSGEQDKFQVPSRCLGCGFITISVVLLCLTHGQENRFESITGWFLLRGAIGGGAARVSSWGQLL